MLSQLNASLQAQKSPNDFTQAISMLRAMHGFARLSPRAETHGPV